MTATAELRGGSSLGAFVDLIRRIGVVRHPIRVTRILRRYGGTLPAAIELGALRGAEHTALVHGADEITYGQLRAALQATATRLADRFAAGTRIGVRMEASPASVVLLAAAIAAGLDVVPLGTRLGVHDRVAISQRQQLGDILDPAHEVRWGGARTLPLRVPGQLLILSSGSTGLPTPTIRRSFGLRALVPLADLDRQIRWPRGPVLVLLSLDHGHGLSAVIAGLLRGAGVLLGADLTSDALAQMTAHQRPTSVTGVPLQLIRAARTGLFDDGVVRTIVSGSSRLDDAAAHELRARSGARLIDCLGTTETGTFAVRYPPAQFQPLAGVRVHTDEQGGVVVDSPLAAAGTRTGDSGNISADGLVLTGRADELVDSAGELTSPVRVRDALDALPQVHSCDVEVVDDDLRGAVLIARVRVHDARTSASWLREALLPVLGRSGLPRRIEVVAGSQAQRPA